MILLIHNRFSETTKYICLFLQLKSREAFQYEQQIELDEHFGFIRTKVISYLITFNMQVTNISWISWMIYILDTGLNVKSNLRKKERKQKLKLNNKMLEDMNISVQRIYNVVLSTK